MKPTNAYKRLKVSNITL